MMRNPQVLPRAAGSSLARKKSATGTANTIPSIRYPWTIQTRVRTTSAVFNPVPLCWLVSRVKDNRAVRLHLSADRCR